MRETPRSLGLYYILCGIMGVMGTAVGMLGMLKMPMNGFGLFVTVTTGLYGLVSAADLWIGANLTRLLAERPHIPIRFAYAGIVLSLLRFNIIGVGLGIYILHQLKRLAKEADVKQEQRVLE